MISVINLPLPSVYDHKTLESLRLQGFLVRNREQSFFQDIEIDATCSCMIMARQKTYNGPIKLLHD